MVVISIVLFLSTSVAVFTSPRLIADTTWEVLTDLYPPPALAYSKTAITTTSVTRTARNGPRKYRFRSIDERPRSPRVPRVGPSRLASRPAYPRRDYLASQRHARLPSRSGCDAGYSTVHRTCGGRHPGRLPLLPSGLLSRSTFLIGECVPRAPVDMRGER